MTTTMTLMAARRRVFALAVLAAGFCLAVPTRAQLAVRGETVHTMAGPAIEDGVVLIRVACTAKGQCGKDDADRAA